MLRSYVLGLRCYQYYAKIISLVKGNGGKPLVGSAWDDRTEQVGFAIQNECRVA